MSTNLDAGTAGRLDVLMVPVSGASGSGEAQVALLIAQELLHLQPPLNVCVVLARTSVLAAQSSVPSILLPDSPTRSTAQMLDVLERLRPRLVVFDSTCRRAQVRLAHRLGARCVMLFWRAKTRKRALALSKLRLWHALWQLTPDISLTPLSWWERTKLRIYRTPLHYVGMVAARPDRDAALAMLPPDWSGHAWWLLCPGGSYAVELFRELADLLVASGQRVVLSVQAPPRPASSDHLIELPRLSNEVLLGLADAAQRCVVNGGGLLLQVIALGQRPLALALMRDQQQRIRAMAAQDLCVAASSLAPARLLTQALQLATPDRAVQQAEVRARRIDNGLDRVVAQVQQLLGRSEPHMPGELQAGV